MAVSSELVEYIRKMVKEICLSEVVKMPVRMMCHVFMQQSTSFCHQTLVSNVGNVFMKYGMAFKHANE